MYRRFALFPNKTIPFQFVRNNSAAQTIQSSEIHKVKQLLIQTGNKTNWETNKCKGR